MSLGHAIRKNKPRIPKGPLAGQRMSGNAFGSTVILGLLMTVRTSITESMSAPKGVKERKGPRGESK